MNKKITFSVLLMAAFSAMMGLGVISPFLPELIKEHHANGFWIGMIFAGYGISRGLIMPFIGKRSDKTGRKIYVAGGLLLFAIVSLLYPRANNIYELTLVRLIHGLSAGMIIPIVMAYVGDLAEEGREGVTASTLNMMFYLGLASGPFLGGYISQTLGFDFVFHAMSGLGIITFLIVVIFLPDIRNPAKKMTENSATYTFNNLIKHNFIKAILISAFLITLTLTIFMSFLPSLAEKLNIDTKHIGIIIAVGLFVCGLLQIPFGKLSDRFDRFGKLIQIGSGTTICMFVLFSMPFCPDYSALLITGCFLGLGTAVTTSALSSFSVGIGKRTGMGTWLSFFNAATCTAFVITPILSGIIMDYFGIDSVFYVFGLVTFFGILASGYFITRRLNIVI
ncbi:MFS transporter [Candidatus Omnitrophota bacterium]